MVADWEVATEPARRGGLRMVAVRTGIVQTPRGGTLQLLYPLFAAGLGGRPAPAAVVVVDRPGRPARFYHRALADPAYPARSTPSRRNLFATRTTRGCSPRCCAARVAAGPGFGPKLLLGDEGASEIAEASQYVVPAR